MHIKLLLMSLALQGMASCKAMVHACGRKARTVWTTSPGNPSNSTHLVHLVNAVAVAVLEGVSRQLAQPHCLVDHVCQASLMVNLLTVLRWDSATDITNGLGIYYIRWYL